MAKRETKPRKFPLRRKRTVMLEKGQSLLGCGKAKRQGTRAERGVVRVARASLVKGAPPENATRYVKERRGEKRNKRKEKPRPGGRTGGTDVRRVL